MGYTDKATQSAYQNGYMRGRRDAWLAANGPCRQCGSSERLEIDHIDPEQKITHRVWSLCEEKRTAELAKCQVLCRACHIKRHADELRRPLVHGTPTAYKAKGCRCDECRLANTRAAAEWRARQKAG